MLVGFWRGLLVHHPQHFRATGFQETPYQERSQAEEHDVEPSCVIPCDLSLDDLRRSVLRHQPGNPEDQLDDVGRSRHRGIRDTKQEQSDPQPVRSAIYIEDRQHDQIGEQERDDAAKADPAIPQDGCQGHVPDRADERDDRDNRADQRTDYFRPDRIGGEEEGLSELVGHPGCEGTRDQ